MGLNRQEQSRADNGDIILSWKRPDPVKAKGIIIGYEIRFSETGAGEGERRKRQEECPEDRCELKPGETSGCCRVAAEETNATISGLDPSKSYDVSVGVVNGAGVGNIQTLTIEGWRERELTVY